MFTIMKKCVHNRLYKHLQNNSTVHCGYLKSSNYDILRRVRLLGFKHSSRHMRKLCTGKRLRQYILTSPIREFCVR